MTNDPELLAELVKANETLAEMNKYLKFTHNFQLWTLIFCACALPVLAIIILGN